MLGIKHERDYCVNTFVIHDCDDIRGMDTIGQRLTFARELRELTQDQLADRAGVAQGTIGNCESGLRKKPRELSSIAKALKVRLEWLEFGRGEMELGEIRNDDGWDDVLGFDQAVGLGNGAEPTEYAEVHSLKFKSTSLRKKHLRSHTLRVFYGKGDSMLPRIKSGDAVLIDGDDTRILDETLYIVLWRGEYYVKRSEILSGIVYFKSDNQSGDHAWRKAKPMLDPKNPIQVIGRVRWIGSWED